MAFSYTPFALPHHILSRPEFFLHGFNARTKTFDFLKTSEDRLTNLAFIDGRDNVSIDDALYQVEYSDMQQHGESIEEPEPLRFIFHIGFCGSTLLANALGHISDKVLCYKEPQVLIDFAEGVPHIHSSAPDYHDWQRNLALSLNQLSKKFLPSQAAVIKPSNWVNNILPDLVKSDQSVRAAFISMPLDVYLVAIFRGGRERIEFIYRLRQHLLCALPEYEKLVEEIDQSSDEILLQAGKTAVIVYLMQHQFFEQALRIMPKANCLMVDYQTIISASQTTLHQVAKTLQLDTNMQDIKLAIAHSFSRHAKDQSYRYSVAQQTEINQRVVDSYSSVIDQVLLWCNGLYETNKIKIA